MLHRNHGRYFAFANATLFSIGVSSLWLDSTDLSTAGSRVFLGSGTVFNLPYSLMAGTAVSDGVQTLPLPGGRKRRVFTLTHSR